MSYPPIYQHFELAFPNIHAARPGAGEALLRGRSSRCSQRPSR